MKIKISQIWSKIVKKWMTACDFLTGGQARTNSYRWLSRRMYGLETRVIKTRGGDRYVKFRTECPNFKQKEIYTYWCIDREKQTTYGLAIDPSCELHFRTPVFFQILPVILAVIGVVAIIVTACLLYWKYR